MLLKKGLVLNDQFCFEKADVLIEHGKIKAVGPNIGYDGETLDVSGKIVAPGMINIHTHGALGYDTCDCEHERFEKMSRFHASAGTTTFLATTTTMPEKDILRTVNEIAEAKKRGTSGAVIGGINLEGPYLSATRRGAHRLDWLVTVKQLDFDKIQRAAGGMISLVTIAPETDGAMEFISTHAGSVHISVGHTAADYETCLAAYRLGATHTTHLFNAMEPIHHRKPGPVAAAYESGAFAELICDGMHVAPVVVKMAFEMFGERIVVITDSICATGLTDGNYQFGGRDITVRDGAARLADGTLSGSTSTMLSCIKNLISWGIGPEDALKSASLSPARAIGMDASKGSIRQGKDADLIVLDADYSLKYTFVGGNCVWKDSEEQSA